MTDPPTKAERLAAALDEWTAAYRRYGEARRALADAEAAELTAIHKVRLIQAEP